MPTLTQLQAETWWGREIVTVELDWLGDELCRRTGRPRTAAGTKGNEVHLRGGHRSQEWILNSRYCTNRTYTVQSGLTGEQVRHIAGFDFTPGAWGTAANRALMVAQTGRLMAEMRAGRLEGVRELYGTTDGRTVTGWDNVNNRFATSDTSHLDHWHLTFDRRSLTDRALMERILAVALGEDDDMTPEESRQLYNADRIHSALLAGQTTVTKVLLADGKTYRDFPLPLAQQAADAATNSAAALAAVRELTARPPVQSAPVDPAVVQSAVTAALSDPQVLAAIAKSVADENARRQQA